MNADVKWCPRCAGYHPALEFTPADNLPGGYTHVALCPVEGGELGLRLQPLPVALTWLAVQGGPLEGGRLPLELVGQWTDHDGGWYVLQEPEDGAPFYRYQEVPP